MDMIEIKAFQVAESFDIKRIKTEFRAALHSGNNSELFYFFEKENRYLYVFDYGVVVFANYDAVSESEFLRFIMPYADKKVSNQNEEITEEYSIIIDEKYRKPLVRNDDVSINDISTELVKIVMLNVGQSAALEYYELLTAKMLTSTKVFTDELESKGQISASKKSLLKFIGQVLNVKNSIVDNLYILDDPNSTWDSEELSTLNRSLKANFDTNARFKDLDYRLKIVEDNLTLFTDLLNHRESSRLEWIVIILILIEVVNIFVGKIL